MPYAAAAILFALAAFAVRAEGANEEDVLVFDADFGQLRDSHGVTA
jgi:hypothetical protein